MGKLLCAVVMSTLLLGCSFEPDNPLLGKWESRGVFTLEFTETSVTLPSGSCRVENYRKENKQISGEKVLLMHYTCIDDSKGESLPLAAVIVDSNTIIAFNDTWHRIK